MTEIASPLSDTAPLDTRALLLPSLSSMAQDLVALLPPAHALQAVQAQQVLQQMVHAVQVLQIDSAAKLLHAMQQGLLPYTNGSSEGPEKAGELLQLAARDVSSFLQALHRDQACNSHDLFASYRALTKLSGKDTAHPADLWDHAWPVPSLPAPDDVEPTAPHPKLRTLLDQHVLALLQTGNPAYCSGLHEAALGLAAYAQEPSTWQLAAAWLQALEYGLLDIDIYAKRLASRLLAYYTQFAKGQETPPAGLQRDLLFFCAQAVQAANDQQHRLPPALAMVLHCSQTIPEAQAAAPAPANASADAASTLADAQPTPDWRVAQPPLAPALPEFQQAIEIQPTQSLVQGLATSTKLEADSTFLQSAEPLSVQLEMDLGSWRRDLRLALPADTSQHAAELARLAWASGCTEIAALAHLLHRCLQRLPSTADASQRQSCQYASEELRRLLHQYAAGFMRRAHTQVLQTLEQLLSELPEPTPQLAADASLSEAEVQQPEAGVAADGSTPADAGTDPAAAHIADDAPPHADGAIVLEFPEATEPDVPSADTAAPEPSTTSAPNLPLTPASRPGLDAKHFGVLEEEMQSAWPLLQRAMGQWVQQPADTEARLVLLRCLHTLKGSARLAGAMTWASQVHAIESVATELPCTPGPQGPACLPPMLEALRIAFAALQQEMNQRYPERQTDQLQQTPLHAVARHAQAMWNTQAAGSQAFRANQLSLQEIDHGLQKLRTQIKDCAAWADTLMLHGEFDLPYEWHEELHDLVRALNDCTDDLGTAQQQLQHGMHDHQHVLAQQSSHLQGLQQTLLHARLQPLSWAQERLKKCVQQAAQDASKAVDLYWQGADTIMDRQVLETLTPALEHLLRNCVAHGIEPRAGRQAAQKAATGKILLRLHSEGEWQTLSVLDDGAGLNVQAIRDKAVHLGLIGAQETVDVARAAQLVVLPGLSTASEVTELAGRGIGMDVVAHTISQLGGSLTIHSKTGKGCHFDIRLPAPPKVEKILPLRAGSWRVALPAAAVEGIRRLRVETVQAALPQGLLYEPHQAPLPLYWTGAVWQQSQRSMEPPLDGHYSVVVVRGNTARWALVVDEVMDTQDSVLQAPHDLSVPVPGLLGTSQLANGQVLQVYDAEPVLLAHETRLRTQPAAASEAAQGHEDGTAQAEAIRPLILLADDSLSVRRLAQHLLQSQGYQVQTAADGLQALQLLESDAQLPALLIADIEMPDMDGLELLRRVRANPRFEQLPVLMLTAHAAGPVSQKAIGMGAQAFLTKPYAPNELLAQVRRYSAVSTSEAHA